MRKLFLFLAILSFGCAERKPSSASIPAGVTPTVALSISSQSAAPCVMSIAPRQVISVMSDGHVEYNTTNVKVENCRFEWRTPNPETNGYVMLIRAQYDRAGGNACEVNIKAKQSISLFPNGSVEAGKNTSSNCDFRWVPVNFTVEHLLP